MTTLISLEPDSATTLISLELDFATTLISLEPDSATTLISLEPDSATTLISLEPDSALLELVFLEQRTGRVLFNVLLEVLLLLLALALEPVVVQVQVEGLAQVQVLTVLPVLALPLQELVPGSRSPVSSSAWLCVTRVSKRRRVRTALSERPSSEERTSARRWPVALKAARMASSSSRDQPLCSSLGLR